jgi:alginate O-acetyltransferase complex protein AlgI
MTVPSVLFLVFALCAAVVFNLSAAKPWRQAVLLVVNIGFLASFSHDPVAYVPFLGFLAFGFLAQGATREGGRPRLFLALVVLMVAAFVWLKRYSFVPKETFLAFPYLLIGFSYVFFRVLHLLIDSHQGAIERKVGLVSYLNYTLNFTTLISGPIQRYQDFHRMETQRLPLGLVEMGTAVERIIIGYFKVAMVSLALSMVQRQALQHLGPALFLPDRVGSGALIAAVYPVYLYFNFSGYTDVVIGVARFFRIELPENFNRPFSSENAIIFWGRWHMTLSGWLRTYVYNPLMMQGMSRITAPSLVRYISVFCLFVTFFLVGVWHGQTTEFLVFGLLTGGGVAANQLYQVTMQSMLKPKGYRALAANGVYKALARGLNFTWFAFTQLWFWSTWKQIADISHTMGPLALGLSALAIYGVATLVLAALEMSRPAVLALTWGGAPVVRSRYVRTAQLTALVVITAGVTLLLNAPAPDIVYKAF